MMTEYVENSETSADKDDLILVESVKAGDMDSFDPLLRRYEGKIYNYLLRLSGSLDDARDLTQDTFLKVFRGLESFRGDSKFSTWLYRIASNTFLQSKRRGKFEPEELMSIEGMTGEPEVSAGEPLPEWAQNPVDKLLQQELVDVIKEAISSMPEQFRTVVVLRDVENFSTQDVGEILDLTVPAVKSRLHRARLMLRDKLNEYFSNGKKFKSREH